MNKDTVNSKQVSITSRDVLTEILRQGAQQMLAMAIENEVVQYITEYAAHAKRLTSSRLPPACP